MNSNHHRQQNNVFKEEMVKKYFQHISPKKIDKKMIDYDELKGMTCTMDNRGDILTREILRSASPKSFKKKKKYIKKESTEKRSKKALKYSNKSRLPISPSQSKYPKKLATNMIKEAYSPKVKTRINSKNIELKTVKSSPETIIKPTSEFDYAKTVELKSYAPHNFPKENEDLRIIIRQLIDLLAQSNKSRDVALVFQL